MEVAGIVITRVAGRLLHRVLVPSCLTVFTNASMLPVNSVGSRNQMAQQVPFGYRYRGSRTPL